MSSSTKRRRQAPPPPPTDTSSSLLRVHGHNHHQHIDATIDNGVSDDAVTVVFRDIAARLVAIIDECGSEHLIDVCFAWLTHAAILDALARAKARGATIAVLVQKEDFLRPDAGSAHSRRQWTQRLRRAYNAIGTLMAGDFTRGDGESIDILFGAYVGEACAISLGPGRSIDDEAARSLDGFNYPIAAVRCVGNHNADNSPSFPRMHNKFVVVSQLQRQQQHDVLLCKGSDCFSRLNCEHYEEGAWCFHQADTNQCCLCGEGNFDDNGHCFDCCYLRPENFRVPVPQFVWTGSFNASKAATNSFENAVIIRSETVALAYHREFSMLFMLSEPLDWTSEWSHSTIVYQT